MKASPLQICAFFGLVLFSTGLVPFHQAFAQNNAQFIAHSPPPSSVCANTGIPISIIMQNTGDETWRTNEGYALGSQNPRDNTIWGGWIGLSQNIVPGEQFEFVKWISTPSTPGTYNFQWQMVQDRKEWFGSMTPNIAVQVQNCAPIPPSQPPPPPPPPPSLDTAPPSCSRIDFSLASPQTRGAQMIITPFATDNVGISRIELFHNPSTAEGDVTGTTWIPMGSTQASGGQILWNTANFPAKTYGIGMRVFDAQNNSDDFLTDGRCRATYTITDILPALSLLAPNGGELIQANSPYAISWSSSGLDHHALYYSLDSGRNWTQIAHPVYGTSYQWITPVLSPQDFNDPFSQNQISTVRIKVVGENSQHQPRLEDESNFDFTLRNQQTSPTVTAYHSPPNPDTSSQITINASASDADGIKIIRIYVDGIEVRTCSLQPFCSTFSNTYPAGTHSYHVTAQDNTGNVGSSPSQTFTVQSATTIPQISVFHSPPSPTATDYVVISANASSQVAIQSISIYVDGLISNSCLNATTCQAPSQQYGTGTHNYYATVLDYKETQRTSQTQSFTVSVLASQPPIQPPSPSTNPLVTVFHSPPSPATSDYVSIQASASDPDGIQSISIYVDGMLKKTCSNLPTCQTSSEQYAAGSHSYYATATDYRGSTGTSTIQNFIVSGVTPPPSPAPITFPAVFMSLSPAAPSSVDTVTITATASDPDGIRAISIYVDGGLIQNCPNTMTCQTSRQFSVGSHTYYAAAIDTQGTEGKAALQNFSVGQFPTQTAPQVFVSHNPFSPAAADLISIQSSASDPDGIQSISIYVDGMLKKTCSNLPTCQTSSEQYAAGSHSYYARAQDYQGTAGVSSTQTFLVQNAPPQSMAVTLSASPFSGLAPLTGVSLSVAVSGTGPGTFTYRFDCAGDGVWDQTISTSSSSYTAPALCSYINPGVYNAKISVQKDNILVQGNTVIFVR